VIKLPKIRPGTGRGTAPWRWRGQLKPISILSELNPAQPDPSVASRHLPVPGRIFTLSSLLLLTACEVNVDASTNEKTDQAVNASAVVPKPTVVEKVVLKQSDSTKPTTAKIADHSQPEVAPPCKDGAPKCKPWERAWTNQNKPAVGDVVTDQGAIVQGKH
jgi:hypothetical protein